jgi:four helix bundle protein
MQPYEKLEAWKSSHNLALAVYRATEAWPTKERYGLTAQIRRAGFSVAVNIVEGRAKLGRREFRRYLDISWGSLSEVEYTLQLARDLGYLAPSAYDELKGLCRNTAKPLFGLLRSMGSP